MRFDYHLSTILTGAAITTALVLTQPLTAQALTGEEVNEVARNITVLIKGKKSHGSGFIISKSDKTYYVLTAYHVVARSDDYKLVTIDKQAYQIDFKKIKRLPGVDLAVAEFTSDKEYRTAKFANSDMVKEGKTVFVSGWPAEGSTNQLIRQFTDGRVSAFLDKPIEGYRMIYTNVTRRGMSGGPVLDAGGRVVGVHGMADAEDSNILLKEGLSQEAAASIASLIKPGFNYAIPTNTFLQLAPQSGMYLALQIENSTAPELGTTYVANSQSDERDKIDNINSVLGTVNNAVQLIRGFFPF